LSRRAGCWAPTADRTADGLGILAAAVTVPAILVAVPPFGHRPARGTYAIDVTTVAGAIFATAWQFVLAPTRRTRLSTGRGRRRDRPFHSGSPRLNGQPGRP
jgi:hypothetical protein